MKKLLFALTFTDIIISVAVLPFTVQASSLITLQHTTLDLGERGPADPAELETFLDTFFAEKMEEMHIPGAAFVMVKDSDIFLMKGYGYADLVKRIPVDPELTIFRAGSISKLFTCTAVMQAIENGLLQLDTDVNQYLVDFQLPATYTTPVTLHHLMTHTAGFEDRWIGYKTYDEEKVIQFGQFMASNIPARVSEPGSVHSYSNYGAALAGYIIEQVSGASFSEYVEENIFQPLGMVRSTFQQPVPDSLISDMAVGYRYKDGNYQAATFIYSQAVPASGISTTAADMAAFMIAHLQDGRYQTARILQEATIQQMHQQQFTHHPELPGMTYGFKERYINGERIIEHGGDLHTFAAQMILLPERNEGFFVVYNRFLDAFREDLIRAIFSRYYPSQQEVTVPEALTMTQEDLSRFVGYYRWAKLSHSTLDKLVALVPGPHTISIESKDDGSLYMSFFGAKAEWRYVPVEPLVFRQISGGLQLIDNLQVNPGDTLVFREDENKQITHGFVTLQNTAMEKLSWYEIPEVMLGSFGVLIIVFISPIVLWPIGYLIRRVLKRTPSSTINSNRAVWLAGIVSGLNLVFIIGLFLTFGEDLVFGMNAIIPALLVVPIITSLLTLVLVVMVIAAWKNGYWSILRRIHYTLITLAAVVFIIWANYWNILGFLF